MNEELLYQFETFFSSEVCTSTKKPVSSLLRILFGGFSMEEEGKLLSSIMEEVKNMKHISMKDSVEWTVCAESVRSHGSSR